MGTLSNLPPGVGEHDVPGNTPEDAAWEALHAWLDRVADAHALDAETTRGMIGRALAMDAAGPVDTVGEDLARLAWGAYVQKLAWKRGQPPPVCGPEAWARLDEDTRAAWREAAWLVATAVGLKREGVAA